MTKILVLAANAQDFDRFRKKKDPSVFECIYGHSAKQLVGYSGIVMFTHTWLHHHDRDYLDLLDEAWRANDLGRVTVVKEMP